MPFASRLLTALSPTIRPLCPTSSTFNIFIRRTSPLALTSTITTTAPTRRLKTQTSSIAEFNSQENKTNKRDKMTGQNQALWLTEQEGDFVVREAPYWTPGPDDILVRNKAVAINPMDWKIKLFGKHIPFPRTFPAIIGADVAGEVAEVGENVTKFKKGDRVIGKANYVATDHPSTGAFQHYTVCPASGSAILPDSISFAAGSVLPLAISTAAMGLYPPHRLGLPLPSPSSDAKKGKILLVWGGSSSCGSAAIQLAAASGARVIATASAKNFAFVKSVGAEEVVDYNDDEEKVVQRLVERIRAMQGSSKDNEDIYGAIDAIGEDKTWRATAQVLHGLGGGKVVSFLPWGHEGAPEGVEVQGLNDTSSLGKLTDINEAVWGRFVPEGLKNGALKAVPAPIVVGKSLDALPEEIMKSQAGVSAGKLVIEL
ncbi:GroES-like protein [Xylona heveae TC161]|uniref:GroES-like protein n=1 Tax=Xylona heveae (strain CBS 132557 / TC161) TaxID=1328760 RepID=A0A161TCF7_XYLHT|nr:GroES-like protein [Xylona heveae TC161]KZF23467.1 GroES-like protein [Xylona heveae TC161]